MKQWKIKLKINKPVYFVKTGRNLEIKVEIEGSQIKGSEKTKYLGIIMDRKLTYKQHLEETKQKAIYLMQSMYPLICNNCRRSLDNKLKFTKAVFLSALSY